MLRFKTKTVAVDDLAEITFLLESGWDLDVENSDETVVLFSREM